MRQSQILLLKVPHGKLTPYYPPRKSPTGVLKIVGTPPFVLPLLLLLQKLEPRAAEPVPTPAPAQPLLLPRRRHQRNHRQRNLYRYRPRHRNARSLPCPVPNPDKKVRRIGLTYPLDFPPQVKPNQKPPQHPRHLDANQNLRLAPLHQPFFTRHRKKKQPHHLRPLRQRLEQLRRQQLRRQLDKVVLKPRALVRLNVQHFNAVRAPPPRHL